MTPTGPFATLALLVTLLSGPFDPLPAEPAPAVAQAADEGKADEPAQVLAAMDWLAGDWNGSIWGGEYHAYYSTPEGGRILSHSRLLQDGKQAFYEFEVFEARDEGVHLQPYPGGRPADGFTLASYDKGARRAVFENPKKDFPTRIVYERVSDSELVITLSDPHGGSDKVERFELSR